MPTGYDGAPGAAATFRTASGHGAGGPAGGGDGVVVSATGLSTGFGLAVTEPLGTPGPGLDDGGDGRADVVCRALVGDLTALRTGCWSSAATRPPTIQASSATANTSATAATARRRQYTDGGSGPLGSIMSRR